MNATHVAAGGGVFAAVLVACFVLVGFDKKPSAVGDPAPVAVEPPAETPVAVLPAPKPDSAAVGGFAQLAKFERGYDGTVGITRSSESAASEIASWTLSGPALDSIREVRLNLSGTRLVTVSDTGIRVLDARTGQSVGDGVSVAKDFPATALSPHGDWAVQASATELKLFDTATGAATTIAAKGKRKYSGVAQFGSDNGWCVVLGSEVGVPALYRVRKGGTVAEPLAVLGKEGDRAGGLHPNADATRVVVERPSEKSPNPRFLQWNPASKFLDPLPAFTADVHDPVRHFRLSPDGKRAALFNAKKLSVIDLDAHRTLLTHVPDALAIGNVAFTPAGDRLVVAYDTRSESGAEPGFAWVLDLTAKAAVGSKLHLGDLGIQKGFHWFVLSGDGSRAAIIDANGTAHLIDADRAFGAGIATGKPSATANPAAPTGPTKSRPFENDT